jgi:hypothetical protein
MSHEYHCTNCGKIGYGSAGSGPMSGSNPPSSWKTKWGSTKMFCSNKCKDEFNNRNSSTDSPKSSSSNQKSGGVISSIFNDDDDRPKTEAEIVADERKRKEVQESDARLFDSIKKLFFGKKNKAAKELHLKLEEIEADIRVAISKGDKDEAGKLIRQLKHDSSLFVSKTNISYSKYWAEKREECLNKL